MPIRITGMNSGLDTDSIIQALMSAYRVKGDKYKKEQTKISWKQDKWKALNSKVYSLYKSLDNLRFTSGYNLKKVTVSDTSKATVSGASNAMNGTQTLKINQLAQAAYLTGDKISAENGKTKLSDLMSAADGASYKGGVIRISGNGKTKDIEVTGDTTVNDFIKQLNDSGTGISASYDNTNKRIYISSKKTGAAAGFELNVTDEAGSKALAALGLSSDVTISKADGDAWNSYYDANDTNIENSLKAAINHIIDQKEKLEENKSLRNEELLDQKFNNDTVKYLEAKKSLIQAKEDVGGDEEDASAMAQLLKMSEKNRSKEYVMGDNGKLRVKKNDGSDDDKVTYTLQTKKYKQDASGNRTEITEDNPVQDGDKTGVAYTFKKSDPSDSTKNLDKTYNILDKYDEYDESTATPAQKAEKAEKDSFDNLKKYATNETAVKNFEKAADSDMEAGDYGKHNIVEQMADLESLSNSDAIDKLEAALTDYRDKLTSNSEELDKYNAAIEELNADLAKPEYAILDVNEINIDVEPDKKDDYVNQLAQKFTSKVKYHHDQLNKSQIVDHKGNVVTLSADGKFDKDGNLVGKDGNVYDKNDYEFDASGNVVDKTTKNLVDKNKALYQLFYKQAGENSGAKMVQGTDAEIELNGVSYTSNTNSFNINGLSIQAQAKTTDEVTVTTATDTQGIYDKIKDFISEYNNVIAEISSLYNAESAKGYEPLTSEEKEAMSDKEVEEWEAKVKGALLRRDDSLGSLMNMMTSAMLSSVKVGDKSYSLASLGIKTTGYFHTTAESRNQLHIDGDEDDDTTSSKTNTLMNMLNSDPDKAIDILKGVTGSLYKSLNKKIMSSNRLKSINSIYNDKEMSQSYSDYTKTISAWEEKIQKIEDSYYKKFSAMEVALSKLQSQQSSLAGLLGQ